MKYSGFLTTDPSRIGLFFFSIFIMAMGIDLTIVYTNNPAALNYLKFVEVIIFIVGTLGFYQILLLKNESDSKTSLIAQIENEKEHLELSRANTKDEFLQLIESSFSRWAFSESEKAIAYYLLRGKSIKEIAEIRSVSESTIRNQCHFIYSKSGLNGKHDLSVYFLQNFLQEPS